MAQEMTNAVRMAQKAGVSVEVVTYPVDESDLSAVHASSVLGIELNRVYKTLALLGDGRKANLVVASIPADCEVDLKALARAAGYGRAEMVPLKDLFSLTGYQRGGCSPLGIKRAHQFFLDERALALPTIAVSAGRRGVQMIIAPSDLLKLTGGRAAPIAKEAEGAER